MCMNVPSTSGSLWFLTVVRVFAKMLRRGLNEWTTHHWNQESRVLALTPPAVAEQVTVPPRASASSPIT